jgi:prephenate dehydratase
VTAVRAAIAGARGSYAEEAAISLLGGDVVLVCRPAFADAVAAVEAGAAERAVIPVENAIVGAVHAGVDAVEASGLHVVGEVTLSIRHYLVACPGATLDEIRTVESHPVALAQCRRFLAAHPQIEAIAADDTASCIRRVVEGGDVTRSAIGSSRAVELYGGTVLNVDVQDRPDNWTRFVLVTGRGPCFRPRVRRLHADGGSAGHTDL